MPDQQSLGEAVERHYLNPPPDVAERRQALADEAKAHRFSINEAMEETLKIELSHPEVWDRLPFEMRQAAALYAEAKASAERVAARKRAREDER